MESFSQRGNSTGVIRRARLAEEADPVDSLRRRRLSGERRKSETDSENDREPDQPHAHLGGGWLAGSLADDG
jgi:hypothetical protein